MDEIASPRTPSIADLRALAVDAAKDLREGDALDALSNSLIEFGVAVSVTALHPTAIERALDRALRAGATIAQILEVAALVSGLGVHSLMASASLILSRARLGGEPWADAPLDERRQALWERYVGDSPFWIGFERELPGFLDALLRLSPDLFSVFFDYCAAPWKSGTVRARLKELIAMACDASPSHRFLPGFRLHLNNAITLGIGRRALLQTLDIAAAAAMHEDTS